MAFIREKTRQKIDTYVIVTVIAVLVWLYAESETVKTHLPMTIAVKFSTPPTHVITQPDPWIVFGLPPLVRRDCGEPCLEPRAGLEPLYAVLLEQSTAFAGPVVLAVGDTHIFRVDKPLYREDGSLVENFTRVEAFGNPLVHWVRVTVDTRDRQVFTFHQELVPGNVAGSTSR